ncbi:Transcriptional regulator, TrmB family [Methanosarcina siciliae T4/M]|uniref:Transcriptional regulator, TrmB family n=1 Tax=Methanosarcina siciliae T4/M TaxID=1434120 RepID=A0A0E3P4I1_9EURY|nr:helix-turn-helix domain-containing protein [Methanosarcina siciliae]AKB28485.1 Transcriptional regulator, TrmB family [Methanosarcina siciliae T4/M]
MSSKLIKNLQKLGFTENEAKIYAVLVCLGQARASEISKAAGVPRAKVYGILRGMEKKGYVRILGGDPILFCCTRPEEMMARIRADFMRSLRETSSGLNALSTEGKMEFSCESIEVRGSA